MKVYVTRHGQTEWNALDKVLGRTDIPLNEVGEEQARRLAASLVGEPIDLVITSPLTRTVQTGRIVAQALGVPAVTADALIEMDFGIFEGVLRPDPVYQAEKKRYFARLEGGESFLDLAGRVYPFLKGLPQAVREVYAPQLQLPERDPERNVLLVSHNGICRVIESYFRDMENDEFRMFQLDNCSVLRFER